MWDTAPPEKNLTTPSAGGVTALLRAWSDGNEAALEQLVPLVEAELRRLARSYMRRERPGHTLQTTALVNEAFLRLTDARAVGWQDRPLFLGIAARLMRRAVVTVFVQLLQRSATCAVIASLVGGFSPRPIVCRNS
jgi:hypothetical protein